MEGTTNNWYVFCMITFSSAPNEQIGDVAPRTQLRTAGPRVERDRPERCVLRVARRRGLKGGNDFESGRRRRRAPLLTHAPWDHGVRDRFYSGRAAGRGYLLRARERRGAAGIAVGVLRQCGRTVAMPGCAGNERNRVRLSRTTPRRDHERQREDGEPDSAGYRQQGSGHGDIIAHNGALDTHVASVYQAPPYAARQATRVPRLPFGG